jgi:hypothetical protein
MPAYQQCKRLARWTFSTGVVLGLLSVCVPMMVVAQVPEGASPKSGMTDPISIDFTTFPDGTPIHQNLNGEYGVPGTTKGILASNEFESLGVVFVPPLPGIIVGVGGWLVSSHPTFFGDIRMKFLVPVTSVTVDIIGSGLNIAARLQAFNSQGVPIGTATHTYTGNTGVPSPFTFTAPPGEAIASVLYNGGLNSAAAASIDTLIFTPQGACLGSDRQVYDARVDFMPGWVAGKNPNGCWTYGWTKDLHGTFNSGGDYDDGNVRFLAGTLILHPSGKDGHAYAHAIWTAPRHGSYLVSSVFFSEQHSIDVDVNILVNRKRVFADTLTQDDTKHTFVKELRLAQGDTIDFAVGPDGNHFLHPGNTGLEAHIVRLTPKQEDHDNKQDQERDRD